MRPHTARKKALGLCTQGPFSSHQRAAPGLTVCRACNAAAKRRVYAGRAARKVATS